MKLKYLPKYSYEDYARWQGDWELIEGIPYAMALSKFLHQKTLSNLLYVLRRLMEERGCDCFVVAELDWIVDKHTVVRPDLVLLYEEPQDYITSVPPFVIEIVSEYSKRTDEEVKYELYEEKGVKYYLLVYPEEKKVKAYKNEGTGFVELESLEFELKDCKIKLDLEKVWR